MTSSYLNIVTFLKCWSKSFFWQIFFLVQVNYVLYLVQFFLFVCLFFEKHYYFKRVTICKVMWSMGECTSTRATPALKKSEKWSQRHHRNPWTNCLRVCGQEREAALALAQDSTSSCKLFRAAEVHQTLYHLYRQGLCNVWGLLCDVKKLCTPKVSRNNNPRS